MKLNLKYSLIGLLILMILYYCLGNFNYNVFKEGIMNNNDGNSQDEIINGTNSSDLSCNPLYEDSPLNTTDVRSNNDTLERSDIMNVNTDSNCTSSPLNSLFPSLTQQNSINTITQTSETIGNTIPVPATNNNNSITNNNSLNTSDNSSDNYADAEHKCDTGMIWNTLSNSCITENNFNNDSVSEIPSEKNDKYILKSQVIPPVCPVCPQPITCSVNNKTEEEESSPIFVSDMTTQEEILDSKDTINNLNNTNLPTINKDGSMGIYGLLNNNNNNNNNEKNIPRPLPLVADFSTFKN